MADTKHTPLQISEYQRTTWKLGELPAIDDTNLNNIEGGIDGLSRKVKELDSRVHTLDGNIWNDEVTDDAEGKVPQLQTNVALLQTAIEDTNKAVDQHSAIIGDWQSEKTIVETFGEQAADIITLETHQSEQDGLIQQNAKSIEDNTSAIQSNQESINKLNEVVGLTENADASLTERASKAEEDITEIKSIIGDGINGSASGNNTAPDLTYAIRELERIVGEGIHDAADGTLAETLTQAIEDLKQQVIESTLVWHYF